MSIYLDYNASSPIKEEVIEYMVQVYRNSYGNADSRTHIYGENARNIVENARKDIADLIGVHAAEVFFTSGSTESNNIALLGLKQYANDVGKKHIIVSSIEHKAVLEAARSMEKEGYKVDYVDPESNGRVDPQRVLGLITNDTLLVSIMHVNNETGVIQPVKEIGDILSDRGILFHIDATQSVGKMVDEVRELKYDMMTFSAHKMYGPQGIGALVLRKKKYKLPPVKSIMYGGAQEHGIRPGTLPVALIAGFGLACKIASNDYKVNKVKCKKIKDIILQILDKSGLKYVINGDDKFSIENTINICLKGISSEALMLYSKQYCGISNGSACNSTKYTPSYVLKAMGIDLEDIKCSLRISWGPETDEEQVRDNFSELLQIARELAY